jgi:hypothetical protein
MDTVTEVNAMAVHQVPDVLVKPGARTQRVGALCVVQLPPPVTTSHDGTCTMIDTATVPLPKPLS